MRPELEFYDELSREKFKSSDWVIKTKSKNFSYTITNRLVCFAVAPIPGTDREAWRIVSPEFGDRWSE